MQNLVIKNDEVTMSSLDFLNNFINPSRNEQGESILRNNKYIVKICDELDLDISVAQKVQPIKGGTPQSVFYLTYDQMMLVGMRESKAVRKSVLAKLKQLQDGNKPKLPQTFAEALQLAADQAKQLELQAPKVAFVEKLVERTTEMNSTQIAQKFGKSAIWLNKQLEDLGVFNKNIKRGRAFKQWFVDDGYGVMKQTEQGYSQALFTPPGELWIHEKLTTEGVL